MNKRTHTIQKAAVLCSLVLLVLLCGCSKYISSYKALGFIHTNTSNNAYMGFHSFEGRMVFTLKSKGEGEIKYTASLEEGSAAVFYDCYGTKSELFTIESGESYESSGGYIEDGTVYIIVETDGKCKGGEFRFSLE